MKDPWLSTVKAEFFKMLSDLNRKKKIVVNQVNIPFMMPCIIQVLPIEKKVTGNQHRIKWCRHRYLTLKTHSNFSPGTKIILYVTPFPTAKSIKTCLIIFAKNIYTFIIIVQKILHGLVIGFSL